MHPTATDPGSSRQRWLETLIVLGSWTLFGLIMASQFYVQSALSGGPGTWDRPLRHALFESAQWAIVTLVIFWLSRRYPLEIGRMTRHIPVHAAAAVLLALGRVLAMVEMSRHVTWLGPPRSFERQFLGWFHTYLLFCVLLVGIAHAVLYYRRYRERERTADRLAAGLAEARLQALKMQLQPHFLFNTLNAISALIPPEAKPARRMVARLGELLRLSLDYEETQEVTLDQELTFLEPYLEIEQARMGDRLTVRMNIDTDALDALVPHLMLQPLLENAIRHGVARRLEPGTIVLSATRSDDGRLLYLEVRDDGPGWDPAAPVGARNRVGLANVRSRLKELYQADHRFEVDNHPEGGATVKISLPLRRGAAAANGTAGDLR